MRLAIEYLPLAALKSYGRTLRKGSKAYKQNMLASVSEFGIVVPILIDEHSTIIAGEGVVAAARELGMVEVPTTRIEHLDDEQVRLLRIALNKIGEQSSFEIENLTIEFGELFTANIDLDFEVTGFSTPEIDGLLYPPKEKNEDGQDDKFAVATDPDNCVARVDDIWKLGDHRVCCGSSREPASFERLMADKLARMVLTDGPYNVPISGNVSGLGKKTHREFVEASGEMSEAQFIAFQTETTRAMAACCMDGALLYLFMDWRGMWAMLTGIRAAELSVVNLAVWVKSAPAMGSFYRSQHELCLIARKGKAPAKNNIQLGRFGRNRSNVWQYAGLNSFGAGRDEQLAMHPTCKNVSMLADAIRDATDRGDIVLDGFLGSGSTLIAAERTGRTCYGVELDPLYVDTIVSRWEAATGREALLEGTEETFVIVAERRQREREAASAINPPPRTRRAPQAA